MNEAAREEERITQARIQIARHLDDALTFALASGLANEAAMIAKLIDATLSGTLPRMYGNLLRGEYNDR